MSVTGANWTLAMRHSLVMQVDLARRLDSVHVGVTFFLLRVRLQFCVARVYHYVLVAEHVDDFRLYVVEC